MAIIVVGGQSRSVGKTSVVAGIIAALPRYNWTAFKVTQYGHGICSRDGSPCDCATGDHSWAVTQERDPKNRGTDSARYLAAGAVRSFWARTEQGRLAEAMPLIRLRIAESENVIFESNSIVKFLRPDLYLTMLDPGIDDFKSSARELFDRADALLLHNENSASKDFPLRAAKPNVPRFTISPPNYVTAAIVDFVRERLAAALAT